MSPLILMLFLKLVSLAGAVASTAGFLSFFFFESIRPWKWALLGGGTLVIVIAESLHFVLARRIAASDPSDDSNDPHFAEEDT